MMRFVSAYVEDQRISVSQVKWIRKIHLLFFSPNILLNKWLLVKREHG